LGSYLNKPDKDLFQVNNKAAFHAPLHPSDTEKQTFGCRHTNPDICAKYHMPNVCAFARADKICTSPPVSWPKQFQVLKKGGKKPK
jgi:hypothetical protein